MRAQLLSARPKNWDNVIQMGFSVQLYHTGYVIVSTIQLLPPDLLRSFSLHWSLSPFNSAIFYSISNSKWSLKRQNSHFLHENCCLLVKWWKLLVGHPRCHFQERCWHFSIFLYVTMYSARMGCLGKHKGAGTTVWLRSCLSYLTLSIENAFLILSSKQGHIIYSLSMLFTILWVER